ncbi:MAG: pitrilysin family protein [Parcubacteria group bacterium]
MNYKKTTLKNGLRIITAPMVGTETATVVAMIGVGSRYETDREAGLSHFIEHMLFKGTQKRPTTLDISTELDEIGGDFNAFTSKDTTAYYAKADARHMEKIIDVIADIYLHSKFEEAEIKKESGTIIQEINMYEDMPMRSVENIFEQLLYPKSSLGRDIAGSKKTVASFRRKDFLDYITRHYMANDTVVCVAGKFDEKKVLAQIRRNFSVMEKKKDTKITKVKEAQKVSQLRVRFKKTDQTHFILGVRAYKSDHRDRYALSLLATILGANMSSRLFIEVREKRGLAYYVRTGVEAYADTGYLATQVGVEHKNLKLAVETILREYARIASEPVDGKELQKAKDFIKGKSVMGMEASDAVAMFFAGQEVEREKVLTLEEKFVLIDRVTPKDVLRVAKDIFQDKKLNLAIIGPHKGGAELKKLLKLK